MVMNNYTRLDQSEGSNNSVGNPSAALNNTY